MWRGQHIGVQPGPPSVAINKSNQSHYLWLQTVQQEEEAVWERTCWRGGRAECQCVSECEVPADCRSLPCCGLFTAESKVALVLTAQRPLRKSLVDAASRTVVG